MEALYMSRRPAPHTLIGKDLRLSGRRRLRLLFIEKHHIRSLQSLDVY
jgi:hypothetical protein